jgi:hypothetical protein
LCIVRSGAANATHTHNKNPQKFVAPLARSCLFVPTGAQFGASYTYNNNTRTKPQVLVPVSAAVDPLNRSPTQKRREGRKKVVVVVVVVVIVVGRAVRPARLSLSLSRLSPVQSGINWSAKINSTHADKNNSSKKVKHKLNPGMGFLFFIFSLLFFRLCVTYNITTYLWSLRKNVVQCYKRPGAVCVCRVPFVFLLSENELHATMCGQIPGEESSTPPRNFYFSLQTKKKKKKKEIVA